MPDLREKLKSLVGAEYVVLDDLNNGAQKPVQIRFYGTDTRKLLELTEAFMKDLRKVPGAVDVALSQQNAQNELQVELHRGLANHLGISVGDAANALRVAFAGIQVGDWVDPRSSVRLLCGPPPRPMAMPISAPIEGRPPPISWEPKPEVVAAETQ